MKVAIHQPHYLPWLGDFAKWAAADLFVLLDTVQYEKNGWQNRNRIKTREGPRWLTVPVNARLGTAIHAVTVDTSQPWRARHFTLIENNYGAAPAWRQYRDELHAFYGREWDRLAPVAVASAEWLAGKLGVTTPTRLASEVSLPSRPPGPRRPASSGSAARSARTLIWPVVTGRATWTSRNSPRSASPWKHSTMSTPSTPRNTVNSCRFSRPLTYY